MGEPSELCAKAISEIFLSIEAFGLFCFGSFCKIENADGFFS
jgi:hypothetical protein